MSTDDWDSDNNDGSNIDGQGEPPSNHDLLLTGPLKHILKRADKIRKSPVDLATSSVKGSFQLFGAAKLQLYGFGVVFFLINFITTLVSEIATGGLVTAVLPIILSVISTALTAGLYEAAFGLVKKDSINLQDFQEGTKHILPLILTGIVHLLVLIVCFIPLVLLVVFFPPAIILVGVLYLLSLFVIIPITVMSFLTTVRNKTSGVTSLKKGFELYSKSPLAFALILIFQMLVSLLLIITVVGVFAILPITILIYVTAIEILCFPVQKEESDW